jgi:hypothetical protein
VKKTIAIALHPTVEDCADILSLKNSALKKRAKDLGCDLSQVDQSVNCQLRKAIRSKCGNLNLQVTDIDLDAEGARPVWEQISKHMPLFQLFKSDRPSTDQDDEAQDPMRAAVKQAIKAHEDDLNRLTEQVRERVKVIAQKTVEKIGEMSPGLASELHPQFGSPKWDSVFKISLTGENQIPVNKRGSGVRRLILLNFFRAQAEAMLMETQASSVIYAIEEPETSQHPNSQQMLLTALLELSDRPGCQVLITTHTPSLARFLPLKSLRYLSVEADGQRKIIEGDDAAPIIAKALGVLPNDNVSGFIGVEGSNDINFLFGIARVLIDAGEDVPDLETLEKDGRIIFIPLGGSNLERWVGKLRELKRWEFHIFDREEAPPKQPKYHTTIDKMNKIDNCKAVATTKLTLENYIHPDAIKTVRPDILVTYGDYDDVPTIVARYLHDYSDSTVTWSQITDKDKLRSKRNNAKSWLNSEAVRKMTPQLLTAIDTKDEIRNWLKEIKQLLANTM